MDRSLQISFSPSLNRQLTKDIFFGIVTLLLGLIIYSKLWLSVTKIPFFKFTDEILIGVFLVLVIIKVLVVRSIDKYTVLILSCILFFVGATFLSPYQPAFYKIFLGAVLHFKWFIFFLLFNYIYQKNYRYMRYLFYGLLAFSLFGILVNFAMGQSFTGLVNYQSELAVRGERIRMVGFEMSPNNIVTFYSILYIYFCFKDGMPTFSRVHGVSLIFIIFITIVTGSRSPLMMLPVVYFYMFIQSKNKLTSAFSLITFIVGAAVILMFFGGSILDSFSETFEAATRDDTAYRRAILQLGANQIAVDYFPFGTGISTYSSKFAVGSRVYQDLGLHRVQFLIEQGGNDNNIAVILGEMGVSGILAILGLLWYLPRFVRKRLQLEKDDIHFMNVASLSVVALLGFRPLLMAGYHTMIYAMVVNFYLARLFYLKYQKQNNTDANLNYV